MPRLPYPHVNRAARSDRFNAVTNELRIAIRLAHAEHLLETESSRSDMALEIFVGEPEWAVASVRALDDMDNAVAIGVGPDSIEVWAPAMDETARVTRDGHVSNTVHDVLRAMHRRLNADGDIYRPAWHEQVEQLIGRISGLLDERAELEALLTRAERDVEVAHTRIRQLEQLNLLLQEELYRTKGKPRKGIIGPLAAVAMAILGGLAGGVGQELAASRLREDVGDTIYIAQTVHDYCAPEAPTEILPDTR